MDLVMFHSGLVLPGFLECNFKQIRLFNPGIEIFFLTNSNLVGDPLFGKYGVVSLDKDVFCSEKITQFETLYEHGKQDFWTVAATRLFYIEKFLNDFGLTNVYHFENDVLLYYDLEEYHQKFQTLFQNLAITPGGPDKCMTGFMFIKNSEVLSVMTQYFIDKLREVGKAALKKQYGMDQVNEMTLMRAFSKDHQDKLRFLPILPFGEYSNNYAKFNSIFDPATWGQFVGGTQSVGPGAKPTDHYIGQLLIAHPEYTVSWHRDEQERNIPYFKYGMDEVKINNLHIHSKNLHLYISQ